MITFFTRRILRKARNSAEQNERIILSERDTARVLELLENPPKPTEALLAAARAFGEQTGN